MTEASNQPDDPQGFILPDAAKLEALAEFAAGAGHEINNPLATIIGRAQLLLKNESDPQRRQMLLSIGAQAYRIRDMIGDTMLFARPPVPELGEVNLLQAVKQVIAKSEEEMSNSKCGILFRIDESIVLMADPPQLSTVISELLRNSRQALQPKGGEIQIAAEIQQNTVILEITDQGRGFTELERQHAFDPFFSGRQAGRGLGFGLSKCWRIVNQHGGRIEIQSATEGPTIVRIGWPISQSV